MPKTCAKTVEITGKACVYEHFFCTKSPIRLCAVWVATSLFRNITTTFSITITTALNANLRLFFGHFSPLSTGLITTSVFWKYNY